MPPVLRFWPSASSATNRFRLEWALGHLRLLPAALCPSSSSEFRALPRVAALRPKSTLAPLMRFPCLSEDLDARRTGYSVPRTPPRRSTFRFRPRGFPARVDPRLLAKAVSPLPGFGPSSETPMGAARLVQGPRRIVTEDGSGSSLEVSAPSAFESQWIG
jgi:hypothetical protein